ncbi:MAG: HDOD domain-containing protein [Pelomonas sp.]|nr:HDOD domain-containing protein [Roseateles sp.]
MPTAPALPPLVGRFKLLKSLGEGAQATVWLAHDPRLDREVAVKALRPGADPRAVDEWLDEARAVSRLTHPNIVPVFEADVQGQQSYLVFEYVPGGTLADKLRAKPMQSAREAVALVIGVLAGLEAAHDAGVIHRDLKPSNILIDPQGKPRVMDFGIAARVSDASRPQRVVGTPGYISPEAAQGLKPCAQMDVFACAVMLAEMLSGQRMNYDSDPWRAVRRVAEQDLSMPDGLAADADDALRAIVQRGLARETAQRWPSAKGFREALTAWLHPAVDAGGAREGGESATLEFLLRRMRTKTDFPAMSDAVTRIQRLTLSESESIGSLANEILKDVALTHKLLRLVNTAQFSSAGAGNVSTVSRAAALVGFAGIRNLALSLILLERMENKGHAQLLREEFLRSLMAASLARELCSNSRESEEAFLCAMFHNFGRLLTEFYFPEEAQQVRRRVRTEAAPDAPPVSEAAASTQVLGISYERLGLGVAKQWGLPDVLQASMRRPEGAPPAKLIDSPVERQRWLARAANDVAELIVTSEPSEAHAKVRAMAQRYAKALGVSAETFDAAADQARQRLTQMAQAMEIKLPKNSTAQRLLAPLTPSTSDSLAEHELQPTAVFEPTLPLSDQQQSREQAVEMLAMGVQDITNAMVESFKLNEIIRMILETMYRSLNFRRVIFLLRDPRSETLIGRFGLGDKVEALVPQYRVPLRVPPGQQPDLFAAICAKGVDMMIQDASEPRIAERLPDWFLQLKAPTFLLLPLANKGVPFALIYADKAQTGSIDLGEKELSLLRTLRNQAVMAFRQSQ